MQLVSLIHFHWTVIHHLKHDPTSEQPGPGLHSARRLYSTYLRKNMLIVNICTRIIGQKVMFHIQLQGNHVVLMIILLLSLPLKACEFSQSYT